MKRLDPVQNVKSGLFLVPGGLARNAESAATRLFAIGDTPHCYRPASTVRHDPCLLWYLSKCWKVLRSEVTPLSYESGGGWMDLRALSIDPLLFHNTGRLQTCKAKCLCHRSALIGLDVPV